MTEPEAANVTVAEPQVEVEALCELGRILDLHLSQDSKDAAE